MSQSRYSCPRLTMAAVVTSLTLLMAGPVWAQTLAGGESHTVVLKSDGTVWTFGNNSWGQLGNNTTTDSKVPIQVSGLV